MSLPAPDEVHVHWRLLAGAADAAVLSADERARAARLRIDAARKAFVAARAWLRRLLGAYLDLAPEAVAFRYGPHGKPELAGGAPLRFNLAHSGAWALCAVSAGRALGVDVERIRPRAETEAIARRFFTPAETAELLALPVAARTAGFFGRWTRREAMAKAMGGGFAASWNADEPGRWSVRELDAPDGYAAAIAVEGGGWTLRVSP